MTENSQNYSQNSLTPVTLSPGDNKATVTNTIYAIGNFLIFILAAITIVASLISLITSIILAINKSKYAKVGWIVFAVSGIIFFLCIVGFTVLNVMNNLNTLPL